MLGQGPSEPNGAVLPCYEGLVPKRQEGRRVTSGSVVATAAHPSRGPSRRPCIARCTKALGQRLPSWPTNRSLLIA